MAQPTAAQRTVIESIQEGGTHVFYSVDFTHEIEAAFGFSRGALVQRLRANTSDPKGLFVSGAKRNTIVEGASSHTVACAIADKLGLPYPSKIGRGSAQMAAMDAIMKHFEMS